MSIRINGRLLAVMLLAGMLASCSHAPSAAPGSAQTSTTAPAASAPATASPAQPSLTPTQLQTLLTPTPSQTQSPMPKPSLPPTAPPAKTAAPTPVPVPTVNVAPDLPDPRGWKASLRLAAKDYPRVDGSTATLPLAIYMRAKITGEKLDKCVAATSFSTTGPAWYNLVSGDADLLVVYEASEEVKQGIKEDGVKLTVKPIGMDALVFLANSGNPVDSLTGQQIIDIYRGRITNWKHVGGNDIAIVPYQRDSNSGSQALMLKLVMKGVRMMDAPAMLTPTEMGELVDGIASYDNTSNALGYSVYYYVRNMYKVPKIKLMAVDGVMPDPDTIASGAYPYVNAFYAVIRSNEPANSNTRKLFNWLTGKEGKRAVVDAGYVTAS